jgi:hypothetical protein
MYETEEMLEEAGEAIEPLNPHQQTDDLVEGIARKRQAARQSPVAEHIIQLHMEEGNALNKLREVMPYKLQRGQRNKDL